MLDYVKLVNSVEDARIRRKLEKDLGGKMVHVKMALAIENFSVHIAPLAGDRLVPSTPKPAMLPTEPEKVKQLPADK